MQRQMRRNLRPVTLQNRAVSQLDPYSGEGAISVWRRHELRLALQKSTEPPYTLCATDFPSCGID